MNIKDECKRLWNWIWAKRHEAKDLDHRDVFMGHIALEILQTSTNEFAFISLYDLNPIHPVDNREPTVKATEARAESMMRFKEELQKQKKISKERLAELMPSATYIRGISDIDGTIATFEGNGRVAALKAVFLPEDQIEIEIDLYTPKNLKRSQKKIQKLRKMYQM